MCNFTGVTSGVTWTHLYIYIYIYIIWYASYKASSYNPHKWNWKKAQQSSISHGTRSKKNDTSSKFNVHGHTRFS